MKKFPLLLLLPLLASAVPSVTGAAEGNRQLVYTVQHSKYGNIGTYTNTIQKTGDMTNVATRAKLAVSILGVSMYSQDVTRNETWQGNRLVSFHGVTTENGKAVELDGKAEGDHFTLTTPQGALKAPADVRVANPWSKEAVDGDIMLTPDRGRLEPISVGPSEEAMLSIGGRMIRTSHVEVLRAGGPRKYEVWLDDKGVPVQFAVVGPDNTIIFTLQG